MANMTETPSALHAQLSALADGELPAHEIGALLDALEAQPQAHQWWTAHHATSAVVCGEVVASASGEVAFWDRLQGRLALEAPASTVSAPVVPVEAPVAMSAVAANDPWWKSMRLASVAAMVSVGVVAALVWPSSQEAQLAVAPVSVVPATAPVLVAAGADSAGASLMLRDPALDALMAAHQQMGGHSAWQAPSGFLRNATFETSGR